jgi:hypothetical protein
MTDHGQTTLVELRFDAGRPRAWMQRVIATLKSHRFEVQANWVESRSERPSGLDVLFELERMLLRGGRPSGADSVGKDSCQARLPLRRPQIVIDFTDAPRDPASTADLYLRPLYDGAAGENAVLAPILAGDLPLIQIRDEIGGGILEVGKPSAETADGLSGALETVMARTATLLAAVLSGGSRPAPAPIGAVAHGGGHSPAAYVLRGIAVSIAKRIYRLCCYAPHWRIGWRHTDDAGIWGSADLSGPDWNVIPSPAHRFYADPFAITWKGRTMMFFEDLDHRTNKGIVSAIEFGDNGPIGPVMPALEEPWHLSYPFLIVHDDELWMIPESGSNLDVAIYRCVEFPGRWERHATLLSGFELADATIVRHQDRHYLFGATRDGAGGYSDTLSIFHADNLFGPWQPHARNPVLLDRASARPAGHFVQSGGRLWRPVQDCTHGYGCALGLAEITELSPTGFAQTVRHIIRPGPRWPGRKLHTLNRCGRLELIDGTMIQPKITAFRLPERLQEPAVAAAT